MHVALIQHRNATDRDSNLATTAAAVAQAAEDGAELVVLAELHTGPYFCQIETPAEFDRAETIPGPSTQALSALAREHRVVLVGSLFERRAPGLYHNTAVVFERDGRVDLVRVKVVEACHWVLLLGSVRGDRVVRRGRGLGR